MERKLLTEKSQWVELRKLLQKNGAELNFFVGEEKPKSYPCIAFYSYSDDIEFGRNYEIGFCYPTDFEKIVH